MDPQKYKLLFDYLYLKSKTVLPSDFIIGFGHFDLKIPEQCGRLYLNKYSPQIVFTGGFGSGSADFKIPEGQFFTQHLKQLHLNVPASAILIEDQSTNTSENIHFTYNQFLVHHPHLETIIIVANAYRQRRVFLTCKKHLPDVLFINAPPETTYEKEKVLFENKGENLNKLLTGEMDRLIIYTQKGYIADPEIPEDIMQLYLHLKRMKQSNPEKDG